MSQAGKTEQNRGFPAPPDMGALIRAFFADRRTYKSALARQLGVAPETVYSYRNRPSIGTDKLWNLCHALKHNFFADIAAALPPEFSTTAAADDDKDARIAELELRLKIAEAERDVLLRRG